MLDSMLPKNTQTPLELHRLQETWPTPDEIRYQLREVFKKEFAKESNDRWNRKELERLEICEKLFKKI
jgi:hypothetical protein